MNTRKWLGLIAAALCVGALTGCGAPVAASSPISAAGPTFPAVPPGTGLLLSWRTSWAELHAVDLKTGEEHPDYEPIKVGMAANTALSPDGRTLAVYVLPDMDHPAGGSLHLIDVAKWEDRDTQIRIADYPAWMVFSPDGKTLAMSYTEQSGITKPHLALVDLSEQKLIADVVMSVPAKLVQFTADSQRIVTYGASWNAANTMDEAVPYAAVYAVPDLAVEWETELTGVVDGSIMQAGDQPPQYTWTPGAAFRADGAVLYVVHAHEDKLTTVDLVEHTTTSVKIGPKLSLLDQIMALGAETAHAKILDGTTKQAALSPDGSRLYVTTEVLESWQSAEEFKIEQTHPNLQVIDTATGEAISTLKSESYRLTATADGTRLLGYGFSYESGTEWTDVIDAATLESVGRINGWIAYPARLPDGRWVLLGMREGKLAVIDMATLEVVSEWRSEGWSQWILGS